MGLECTAIQDDILKIGIIVVLVEEHITNSTSTTFLLVDLLKVATVDFKSGCLCARAASGRIEHSIAKLIDEVAAFNHSMPINSNPKDSVIATIGGVACRMLLIVDHAILAGIYNGKITLRQIDRGKCRIRSSCVGICPCRVIECNGLAVQIKYNILVVNIDRRAVVKLVYICYKVFKNRNLAEATFGNPVLNCTCKVAIVVKNSIDFSRNNSLANMVLLIPTSITLIYA